jgi:hypothetical protein
MSKFEENTTMVMVGQRCNIDCNKGLWGVSCANKEQALREAQHYFFQYDMDGEYDVSE